MPNGPGTLKPGQRRRTPSDPRDPRERSFAGAGRSVFIERGCGTMAGRAAETCTQLSVQGGTAADADRTRTGRGQRRFFQRLHRVEKRHAPALLQRSDERGDALVGQGDLPKWRGLNLPQKSPLRERGGGRRHRHHIILHRAPTLLQRAVRADTEGTACCPPAPATRCCRRRPQGHGSLAGAAGPRGPPGSPGAQFRGRWPVMGRGVSDLSQHLFWRDRIPIPSKRCAGTGPTLHDPWLASARQTALPSSKRCRNRPGTPRALTSACETAPPGIPGVLGGCGGAGQAPKVPGLSTSPSTRMVSIWRIASASSAAVLPASGGMRHTGARPESPSTWMWKTRCTTFLRAKAQLRLLGQSCDNTLPDAKATWRCAPPPQGLQCLQHPPPPKACAGGIHGGFGGAIAFAHRATGEGGLTGEARQSDRKTVPAPGAERRVGSPKIVRPTLPKWFGLSRKVGPDRRKVGPDRRK
eukprot:gene21455-biopygen11669